MYQANVVIFSASFIIIIIIIIINLFIEGSLISAKATHFYFIK